MIDDTDAYLRFPQHNWVYDRLQVAKTQGLVHGPHGVDPPSYPVMSKPLINLEGLGLGCKILQEDDPWEPGHMWCEIATGLHMSTDLLMQAGECIWHCTSQGLPKSGFRFEAWEVDVVAGMELDLAISWVKRHLRGYNGPVNVETIGHTIIEVHLRPSEQFLDFYGSHFAQCVDEGKKPGRPQRGWSMPLWVAEDKQLVGHVPPTWIYGKDQTALVHMMVKEGEYPSNYHPGNAGGWLVGWVNSFSRITAERVRDDLLRIITG